MRNLALVAVLAVAFVLASAMRASAGAPPSFSITMTGTSNGITQVYAGGTEGSCRFNAAEMVDLGLNDYRIWADMARFEPVDDDGVYGSPSIAEIKANPNIINWSAWDYQFNRLDPFFFKIYEINPITNMSTAQMLAACRANNISVAMSPHPYFPGEGPTWINPVPVRTEADRNEWWEYVFALCYYCNVLHDWQVDYWEVGNECDLAGGGFWDKGGTWDDYAQLVILTADAVNYVYSTYLGNREHHIGAPVASLAWNVRESERRCDAYYDVQDYHVYDNVPNKIDYVGRYTDDYDTDAYHEPQWISEWGILDGTYDTVASAMQQAVRLNDINTGPYYVLGHNIYNIWPWEKVGWTAPHLITSNGTYTETAYAFKTYLKATKGAKDKYVVSGSIPNNVTVISTKDAGGVYISVVNTTTRYNYTITANISAHRMSGTGTVYEYSAARKCTVASNPVITNGTVVFTSPKQSVVTLWVP